MARVTPEPDKLHIQHHTNILTGGRWRYDLPSGLGAGFNTSFYNLHCY